MFVLGLDAGIKDVYQINMVIAGLYLGGSLFYLLGPTVFILNAMIQNAGVYIK